MSINRKASILFLICVALFLVLSTFFLPLIVRTAEQMYLFSALFVSVPAFLIPAIVFRRKHSFPLFRAPRFTHILLAILCGIGCILLNEALYFLNEAIFFGIEVDSAATSAESITGMNTFVMFIALAVIPPISEEFIMRGTMLEAWRRTSPWGAAILTALLFALLHAAPSAFIIYFGMGILFAAVYLITRNVYLTIIIHFVNNIASVLSAASLNSGEMLQDMTGELSESAGAASQTLDELTATRGGCLNAFFNCAIIAAVFIVPAVLLLKYSCKKLGLGMYAPEEPIGSETLPEIETGEVMHQETGSLFRDPILWITLGILIVLNIVSGLIEFKVIELG